jgi:hypothetical protein
MESLSRAIGNRFRILHRVPALAFVTATTLCALCLSPLWTMDGLSAFAAQQPQEEAPRVDVLDSNTRGLTLDVTIPAPIEQQVQQQATTYQRLSLLGVGPTSEIGQPELPSFLRFVAIPKGAEVQIQILADQLETRSGYLLYPAQEPQAEQGEEPPFILDAASYQIDEFRPSDMVTVEGPYTIRGVEVVLVRFHPAQYNAASGTLRIHSSFRVALSFAGGGPTLSDERLRSPYFEPLLASTLLNYTELTPSQSIATSLAGATGCDYLIITAPALVNQANVLADWKIRKGIDTCVRTTSQTGSTASAIRSYIQNAYDTWSPPPSFVLFLGDAELIPTNYETVHPQQQPLGSLIGTDLYYATVDGADYFPDISTGRISVDTASQALNIINKIINYERNPPHTASFYSTVALAAYFADENRNTYEDRDWVRTSEQIGTYLGSIGYDEIRIYYAEPEPLVNPLFYSDGTPLPSYLLRSSGFPWGGNTTHIVNWVNSGTLILNHRDHGWRMMWAVPELQVSHVLGLTNGNRLPVVFSMNCETGWFDNETDDPLHGTGYYEVTFAEAWQRNQNGGAAGIVAPTRISYGGYNDELNKGLIDAIWLGFLPYAPASGPFSSPQYRMGPALEYAKLYMATIYSESTTRKITFEMFHYFGDPTMEIWTTNPSSMAVYHAPIYYAGPTPYTVEVEDGALVSLVRDGEILATAISTGGTATFTSLASLPPGGVYLTVTKHDRRPYESAVLVLTEGMVPRAYLPLASR